MNDRNRALLFDENTEDTITVTLTDEDGNDIEAEIIAAIEIEELQEEFVAALPTEPTNVFEENEAIILHYSEDANGDPVFSLVEDDELFEIASEAFNQFLTNEDDDDDDDDDEDDDYLGGEIIPGVTIKND